MWIWVDRIGGVVLDVGLPICVLIGVVSLLMIGCRQPARRLRLARLAMLLLPVLVLLSGFRLLPRFDLIAAAQGMGPPPEPTGTPGNSWTGLLDSGLLGATSRSIRWAGAGRILTLLYLAVVIAGLARLALGFLGLRWLTGRSRPPSDEAMAVYVSIPCAPGRSRPRLLVVERIRRPALVGLFRPTILIPLTVDQPEALDQLRLSLLHELAHAEGADPLFGLLANLAQVFCWFLPPVWWIAAQMRLDHEFLADRRAAAGFGPLGDYASSLLAFARPGIVLPVGRSLRGDGFEGQGSALFQRVLMLIRCPFSVEQWPPMWWTIGLICFAVPLTLGSACLSIRSEGGRSKAQALPSVNAFPMTSLTVPPSAPGPHGRSPLFELPIRLPEEFDLSVEVWGDPATLFGTRVVGLLLETPGLASVDASAPASWHLVRVRRDRSGVSLWINGREGLSDREPPTLTTWLSVESAPNREGRFQKLLLSW